MTSQDITEIKQLIVALQNQTTCSQSSIENRFSELATQVSSDVNTLKTAVNDLNAKVSNDVGEIKIQLSEHLIRIENTEDDIERLKIANDLRVSGIPVKDNENLLDSFRSIASEIGFDVGAQPNPTSIERIPILNKVTGAIIPSNTIMIHFVTTRCKQQFYSFYLNKMPLDPKKFGLNEQNRIVIGEHLTRKNAQIFKAAQTMKKNKKIAQTFTEDGIVKVKFEKGKSAHTYTIRSTMALESIIAQYESNNITNTDPPLANQPTQQENTASNNNNTERMEDESTDK